VADDLNSDERAASDEQDQHGDPEPEVARDHDDEAEPIRDDPGEKEALGDLDDALEGYDYPTTTDELAESYGGYEVETQAGQTPWATYSAGSTTSATSPPRAPGSGFRDYSTAEGCSAPQRFRTSDSQADAPGSAPSPDQSAGAGDSTSSTTASFQVPRRNQAPATTTTATLEKAMAYHIPSTPAPPRVMSR
jgi:hypothetical protein